MTSRASLVVAACACAGALAVAATWLAAGRTQAAGPARDLLPDLDQVAPGRLNGETAAGAEGRRFLLGFASAVENVGAGPLLIRASRPSRKQRDMSVAQIVVRSDGSRRTRPLRGALVRYTYSEDHQHWHYLRFDRYELRRADGGARIAPDRKTGFCLGDRYRARRGLPNQPRDAVLVGECGKNQPRLLRIEEGISVGYGDDYKPSLEGQQFDITGLPEGEYLLVHRVNADRAIRESSYANNAASMRFRLAWPDGQEGPPRIDVVRRCGATAACP